MPISRRCGRNTSGTAALRSMHAFLAAMARASDWSKFRKLITDYISSVRSELDAHWNAWRLDLTNPEVHEVVGALLARQVTLATQLARAPDIWNSHLGPVILRSMADAYIVLAWILTSPEE